MLNNDFIFISANQGEADNKPSSSGGLVAANRAWSDDEMQLLVKATTLFPIGTASRLVYVLS